MVSVAPAANVYFISDRPSDVLYRQLYKANPDGTEVTRITEQRRGNVVSFIDCPQNGQLFYEVDGQDGSFSIGTVNVRTGDEEELFSGSGDVSYLQPSCSADGSLLSYVRFDKSTLEGNVLIYNLRTKREVASFRGENAAWSLGGQLLAYEDYVFEVLHDWTASLGYKVYTRKEVAVGVYSLPKREATQLFLVRTARESSAMDEIVVLPDNSFTFAVESENHQRFYAGGSMEAVMEALLPSAKGTTYADEVWSSVEGKYWQVQDTRFFPLIKTRDGASYASYVASARWWRDSLPDANKFIQENLSLSPDGKWAVLEEEGTKYTQIALVNLQNRDSSVLVPFGCNPRFTADSRYVYFSYAGMRASSCDSERQSLSNVSSEIYVVGVDGSGLRGITNDSYADTLYVRPRQGDAFPWLH